MIDIIDGSKYLDAALAYAARGWRVIPTMKKSPRIKEWPEKASTDPDAIRSLFATYPEHDGVGVPFGRDSGIIDIECDDPQAEETLLELFDGNIPRTPTFGSTRGKHRLFRWHDQIPRQDVSVFKLGKLEFRTGGNGKGAQTVFPPSANRVWIIAPDECEPAEIPSSVIERIKARVVAIAEAKVTSKTSSKVNGTRHPSTHSGPLDIIDRARRYLAAIPPAINGQGGHPQTFLAAQHLVRGFELSDQDSFDLLSEWNRSCEPPWSDAELRHKIQSARTAGDTVDWGAHLQQDRPHGTNGTPPAFTRRTAGELIRAFPNLRPSIIEGLIRRGETMNVIAPPKTGKSWLSMGLGLSIVSGRKWLGKFWTTTRGKVMIVDNELHEETSAHRLPEIADAMGIQPEEYSARLEIVNLRGELMDLNRLAAHLLDIGPGEFDLFILDAMYRFTPAGNDENSNADVARLYNTLDAVAGKLGSAFCCIHHTSKGVQGGKSITDTGSGAGSQSRAADCHLVMRQHEEDGAVVVEAAVRSFAPMTPFCMRWNFPVWTPADDLDPKDLRQERPRKAKGSATESGESSEDARQQRDQEARQKVLDAYATFLAGETINSLRDAAGMSGAVFGPINSALIREGLVEACTVQKSRREFDGFRLVTRSLGHSDKTLFSVSESELSDMGLAHRRTSVPPLGDAVRPTMSQPSDARPVCQSEREGLSESESDQWGTVA